MEPWEIMISESQERMVAAVRPQLLDAVREVCARWELPCTVIGEVTEGGVLHALPRRRDGRRDPGAACSPTSARATRSSSGRDRTSAPRPSRAEVRVSKRWIYEQYDQLVGSRTVRRPGLDAAVLRLRPSLRGLAVSLQGGSTDAVARSTPARRPCSAPRATSHARAASRSASPTASTSAIPRSPRSRGSSREAIDGIAAAATALGAPVVSGNVSLYNETDGRSIPPTPVVGCVGLVPDVRQIPGPLARRRRRSAGERARRARSNRTRRRP